MRFPSVNVNFKELGQTVTRMIGRGKLWTRIHEPELWIGAGLVVGVGAVVAAGVQGTKCRDILDKHAENMASIDKAVEYAEMDGTEYSVKEQNRDKWAFRAETGVALAKKFAVPGIAVVTAGFMILRGYEVQKARTRAVAQWGMGILATFTAYRNRVIKDQGLAKDKEYYTGLKEKTEEVTTFDENGKAVQTTETTNEGKMAEDVLQRYFTFIFGPTTSSEACYDGQKNLYTLMQVENAAHINMISHYFTSYNWILKDAGMDPRYYPPTAYGQMFGAQAVKTASGGWERKIHLSAHIIPGRDDGSCLVTVYGMEPMIDLNNVDQALGEETIGVPYLEDFKDNIVVPTGGTCASEFMFNICEKARQEEEENRRQFMAKVNSKEV